MSEFHKKVLVIDLDPQTNATVALVGEDRWAKLDRDCNTVYNMFDDALSRKNTFDINRAICKGASNLGLANLHLLSSSIRLIEIQDDMNEIGRKTSYSTNPHEVLKAAISSVKENYDYILIDCPPNLGLITLNGIEVSDYYFIPTIADVLSTYGLPQIVNRIHQISRDRGINIKCLGLIVTKYKGNSGLHHRTFRSLPIDFKRYFANLGIQPSPVFRTRIPEATATAEMADHAQRRSTFKQKYGTSSSGGQPLHKYVRDMTEEFIGYAG